jgi:HEAT repeats
VNRRRILLAIFALLETGISRAYPVPTVSITSLVELADLIIVGRVERVQPTGAGEITFHEHTYTRRDFRAEITVDQTIKGDPAARRFGLSYSTPAMDSLGNVAEGGLLANTYRVVFLKETPTGYAFASPYYASLPAGPTPCGQHWGIDLRQDAYHEVLQKVLDVLCAPSGVEEKRLALGTLNWDEDSSATPFLKAAMSLHDVRADPVLRTSIISDLLRWKDLTVLSLAEDELFLPTQHAEGYLKSNLLLAASSLDSQISVPLLTRALKLPEPEARVGAARFLEYTNSDTAMDGLLSALDDPDRDVQFAVMQSLGNLTKQHQWRPQTTETDAAWFACIQHWREFGKQRRRTLAPSSAH